MTEETDPDIMTLKIVIGGRWGVGKTSLRRKYMGDARFKRNYLPTIGSDFSFKELNYLDHKMRLLLWDLAGENRFKHFRGLYFQGARGALMVFDLTDRESFLHLDEWVNDLKLHTASDGVPIILLGNKSDLILDDTERCFEQAELDEKIARYEKLYGNRFKISYVETSALNGKNVDKAFAKLLQEILQWMETEEEPFQA